jgi:hypothetical protein
MAWSASGEWPLQRRRHTIAAGLRVRHRQDGERLQRSSHTNLKLDRDRGRHFRRLGAFMTDDIKEIVRRLRAVATRADAMSRKLAQHRRAGFMTSGGTAMAGLAQLPAVARDFHQQVETSYAALPAALKERLT